MKKTKTRTSKKTNPGDRKYDVAVRKRRSFKKYAAVGGLISVIAVGGIMAYFTDIDMKENRFTVGEVTIDLEEPHWEPEKGENLYPNQNIPKDPRVTNTGINDAYVFLMVKVPVEAVITAQSTGVLENNGKPHMTQLFTYEINSEWDLIEEEEETIDNHTYNTYVYAYREILAGTATLGTAVGETTTPLFDSVTFANIIEGQITAGTVEYIDVDAYAVQSDGLKLDEVNGTSLSNADYAKAWSIYKNQNAPVAGK